MKKIISLLLAVMLCMGLFAACGSSLNTAVTTAATTGNETPKGTEAPEGTEDTESTEPVAAAFTTVEEGKLIMATNAFFPPYEYYEGEQIVGIDAEIAAAIAKKLGLELVINNMEFDSIITAVTTGAADFGLAGMTVTEDRLLEVDFSISYASGVQAIIVKEGSAIASVDDLAGEFKIGVQRGTTGDIYATDEFGSDRVTAYSNGNEAILALQNGDVECVIIDNEPAKAFVAANEGLKVLDSAYAEEDYAACFKQENDSLRDAVNTAIEELIMDGTIDAIVEKYIPTK